MNDVTRPPIVSGRGINNIRPGNEAIPAPRTATPSTSVALTFSIGGSFQRALIAHNITMTKTNERYIITGQIANLCHGHSFQGDYAVRLAIQDHTEDYAWQWPEETNLKYEVQLYSHTPTARLYLGTEAIASNGTFKIEFDGNNRGETFIISVIQSSKTSSVVYGRSQPFKLESN